MVTLTRAQTCTEAAAATDGVVNAPGNVMPFDLQIGGIVMRRRARPEQLIQKAVFDHLRQRGRPGVFAFHVPNGGYRKPIEAAIMKGLGVRAGVPDIIAIHQGRVYGLELKADGGRATPKQLQAVADMEAAGAYCCIAEGLDRALAVLESWGLLRGVAA